MSLENDIDDLVQADVISDDVAEKIRSYYSSNKRSSSNRLFTVFGVLGAILVGLGIILILAHNWDNLSRLSKSVIAFIPLILGQVLCGIAMFRKAGSKTWRESSSVFLFFAIGACIALISQIYNIHGELSSYILTWMFIALPLILH